MTRKRNARFCKVCGQAFHGHGLWRTCPGCRAEMKARKRMAKGWNLAPGVTPDDIDEWYGEDEPDEVPVMCGTCRFFEPNPEEPGYCRNFDCDVWPDEDCTSWERE